MKFEKLLRLGPYAAFLQRRWRLAPARAAGALHNVFVTDYKCKKASLLETLRTHSKGWGGSTTGVCAVAAWTERR